MVITRTKTKYHKYLFQFPYDQKKIDTLKRIQKEVGWQELSYAQNPNGERGWAFSTCEVYNALLDYFPDIIPEDEVSNEFSKIKETLQKLENRPENEDLPVVSVDTKKELFPFQRQAVAFVEHIGGKALIADEMGMGKSAESIGYAVYKDYASVLIICPASVKENWKREINEFAGKKAFILEETDEIEGDNWEIVGYPNLEKFKDYLKNRKYDLIIVDECQYIKNSKAKRTKQALKLLKQAKDVIFLTGTPILNRPIEIYNVFNFIRPMRFWDFAFKYCAGKATNWGYDFTGASNLNDLRKKMGFMIRRSKQEVLDQLPDKTRTVLEVSIDNKREYNQVKTQFKKWLIENDKSLNALAAEALTKLNYLKQVVALGKDIKPIVDDFLENDKKILVFSQFREVVKKWHEQYKDVSVMMTGESSDQERYKAIDSFQNDPNVKIFFLTIRAGGVGINLTASDTVLFLDLAWTPADHQQAEDRAHRIGQKNNVNIYYLIDNSTIDKDIWSLLRRKQTVINNVISGDKSRRVHIRTLLKKLST